MVAMEVTRSRRILVLGSQDVRVLDIVKGQPMCLHELGCILPLTFTTDLTGSAPQPNESGSIAGLLHEWRVKTAYYTALVPIWIDDISDLAAWQAGFLAPEAKEVVDEVGAWLYCFKRQDDGSIPETAVAALNAIHEVVERHANYSADTAKLAVAVPGKGSTGSTLKCGSQDEQEEICMEYGFEYVDYAATGKNEYGEKVGFERLKEALEANEWTAEGEDEESGSLQPTLGAADELDGLGREEAEWTAELFGVKASLHDVDAEDKEPEDDVANPSQAADVDDLDRMLVKLWAVKEESAGLPEEQRKRIAAKAVRELMKNNPSI